MGPINFNVCHWHAFPALCTVTLPCGVKKKMTGYENSPVCIEFKYLFTGALCEFKNTCYSISQIEEIQNKSKFNQAFLKFNRKLHV